MEQIGITEDGKVVVGGVAALYFRDGTPLSLIFDQLSVKNMVPSWPHLYKEFSANGMSHDRIIHLLNEHMLDAYGKKFREVVTTRLNLLHSKKLL